MIRVVVKYGNGDRKAAVISDPLITDEASALMRAKQELADYIYVHMTRTLSVPHDPAAGINGEHTGEFAYQPLSMYGNHIIVARSMTFTPTSATDEVTLEQYREMVL